MIRARVWAAAATVALVLSVPVGAAFATDGAELCSPSGPASRFEIPAEDRFGFLGKPGDQVWVTGADPGPDLTLGVTADPAARWSLGAVDGPGEVYAYLVTDERLEPVLGTGPGWPKVTAPNQDSTTVTWAFTAPGRYTFDLYAGAAGGTGAEAAEVREVDARIGDCTPVQPPAPATETPDVAAAPSPTEAPAPAPRQARREGEAATATPRAPRASNPAPTCTTPTAPAGGGQGPAAGSTPPRDGGASSADVVRSGHYDLGAVIDGNRLDARIKDDRSHPPAWVGPSTIEFALGSAARATIPGSGAYGFLGDPGDEVWILPQTQSAALPWLGWNTQHETVRSQVSGPVRFTLDRVAGPGRIAVFLNDSFGGVGSKKFGTAPGFPRAFDVALNVHAHGNWAFTEPGTYRVTLTQSARLRSGKAVSDTATLTFRVGGPTSSRMEAPVAHLEPAAALVSAVPAARTTACATTLGPTGAPDTTVLAGIGGLLVLAGAIAVAGSVALNRRDRTTGR